jgi:hypothetical protein
MPLVAASCFTIHPLAAKEIFCRGHNIDSARHDRDSVFLTFGCWWVRLTKNGSSVNTRRRLGFCMREHSTRQMRRQMVTFAEFGWLSAEADDIDNRNR